MILLLDIGNTSLTYGVFRQGKFTRTGYCEKNDIPKIVNKIVKSGKKNKKTAVICSVVPKLTNKIKVIIKRIRSCSVHVIGDEIVIKFIHKYLKINKLGCDRSVNIFGAIKKFRGPCLVLDLGTAIKADYISNRGVFEGGMIIPGPGIALDALRSKAALLPKKPGFPKPSTRFLGSDTEKCITSGIYVGYGSMIDGIIRRFRDRYGRGVKVVVTGGFSQALRNHISEPVLIDPLFTLKSMLLVYKEYILTNRQH